MGSPLRNDSSSRIPFGILCWKDRAQLTVDEETSPNGQRTRLLWNSARASKSWPCSRPPSSSSVVLRGVYFLRGSKGKVPSAGRPDGPDPRSWVFQWVAHDPGQSPFGQTLGDVVHKPTDPVTTPFILELLYDNRVLVPHLVILIKHRLGHRRGCWNHKGRRTKVSP